MPDSIAHTCRHALRQIADGMRISSLARLLGLLSVLISTLAYAGLAYAEPARVQILLSDTGGAYAELVAGLEQQLSVRTPGQISLNVHLISENPQQLATLLASKPSLVVPVGMQATAQVLRSATPLPVLSLLMTEDSYTALLPASTTAQTRSAIFLDQPLSRQLNLLQLLLPRARHVITLESAASRSKQIELKALSMQRGLQLETQAVAPGSNPIKALTPLLEQADVLLALPDPAIFNRSSLQAILLTTYRSEIPVLGFSQAYVRAGALSAVHSTAQQIGKQAGDWIADMAQSGNWQLGAPRHPIYYSVSVNRQVAQSLGIRVADDNTLLTQLRQQDAQKP